MPDKILVVDDDDAIRELLVSQVRHMGYECAGASSALDGLTVASTPPYPGLVLSDVEMPGLSGIELLRQVHDLDENIQIVMVTANDDMNTVRQCIKAGAYDYLTKPLDRTRLIATVRNAVAHHQLAVRVTQLEREVDGRGYAGIVGASPTMRHLYRSMDRVAPSDITVLIQGESGTGKELVAQGLHEASGRRDGPFIAVNCAAIPETLEASEFFGHERGAFTGAEQRRAGRFEQADGGTLFLDEVGELSLSLQAKLLRVLQERSFQRLGGNTDIRSDFRLIAATHRNLEEEVRAGRFREDLFFRIVVFELELPPLRARGDDLHLLAEHFLGRLASDAGHAALRLSPAALRALFAYAWPGNVRELQNAMERAALLASDGEVRPGDLPRRILGSSGPDRRTAEPMALGTEITWSPASASVAEAEPERAAESIQTLDEVERDAIKRAIERTGGNLSEVVRQLGIGRTTLYRKIKRYGLDS